MPIANEVSPGHPSPYQTPIDIKQMHIESRLSGFFVEVLAPSGNSFLVCDRPSLRLPAFSLAVRFETPSHYSMKIPLYWAHIHMSKMASRQEQSGHTFQNAIISGEARAHLGNVYNLPPGMSQAVMLSFASLTPSPVRTSGDTTTTFLHSAVRSRP